MNHLDITNSIDIIAPFHVLRGDNWHAIDLYLSLRDKAMVKLWSVNEAHAEYANSYPVHIIRPFRGDIPLADCLMICGADIAIGNWYEHSSAQQVVLMYTQSEPGLLCRTLNRLYRAGRQITIHYATQALKEATGLPGEVVFPEFDCQRFLSYGKASDKIEHSSFKIGRASRDVLLKHHFRDPTLYHRLLDEGFIIEIMGGTCLSPWLGNTNDINLMPECPHQYLPDFFSGLDCFFYRTSPSNRGGVDRVVVEAMASGLPVVVENCEAYTDLIDTGTNGFLFSSEEEALDQLVALRDSTPLRNSLCTGAKTTVGRNKNPIENH